MFISELSKTNPRINDSRNVDCGLDGHWVLASQDGQIYDRLALASLIRRSQSQRGAGYPIHFLQDFYMIAQFFPVTRHRRFEDIQAMVYLIGDARQILSLLIGGSLNNLLINPLFYLNNVCLFPRNPLASPRSAIQGVDADPILRCNEATTLASNEVSFNRFPVYGQSFRHKPSLSALVHKVKASMIPRIEDALTHNQRSNQP